jgi:hypothetical protein
MKRHWPWLLLALAAAALVVPYYSTGVFRGRMQSALERTLKRGLRFDGPTHLRLLPWPAFVAEQVVIAEDPRFSLEPFAYVAEIAVEPSWTALLSGRLEASKLRLTEPSVNLMRTPEGWNVQSIAAGATSFPDIETRNGRLNFKQQNEKSAFYLANVLADISAPSRTGDIDIFVEAEPARTDRGPQGFGKFSLRGQLTLRPQNEPKLDFQVELLPSAIHAFNFFFGARSVDFAGKLSSRGRLAGPLSAAVFEGSTQFEGLDAAGFLPFGEKSDRLVWKGLLDLPGQRFSLNSEPNPNLRVRMRARDLFQSPRGAILVEVRDVALPKLLDLARQANAKLPAGTSAQGRFSGVVGFSLGQSLPNGVPVQGLIWFDQAALSVPENPLLEFGRASVVIHGPSWALASTSVTTGRSQSATLEANWNSNNGALQLAVATQSLGLNELRSGVGLLLRSGRLPLLQAARGGTWQGNLFYERKEDTDPGAWRGRLSLRNSVLSLEGFPHPLEISTTQALFDPNRVDVRRMRATWNGLDVEGSYTYFPSAPRPSEFDLIVTEARLEDLAQALAPALEFPQGLLERMRLRRVPIPDWLSARHARGRLLFKELATPEGYFHPLVLDLDWRATQWEAKLRDAAFTATDATETVQLEGDLRLQLYQASPRHSFEGHIRNWPTPEGPADFAGKLEFSRLANNLWDGARAEGTLHLDSSATDPARFQFRDGKLIVESESTRRVAVSPRLWPLQLEAEP